MRRASKTKRRQQAQKRAAASTAQFSLSDHLLTGAAALVAGKEPTPDARVTELFLAWSSVRVLEEVLLDHATIFARRVHAEGREEDDCPALRGVGRIQRVLSPERRALMQAMVAAPTDSVRGLALKLLVWRWEASHRIDGALTERGLVQPRASARRADQCAAASRQCAGDR